MRRANDRIADKAERYRFQARVPMLCECSDPACDELVLIALEDYRRARREQEFLTAGGHHAGLEPA